MEKIGRKEFISLIDGMDKKFVIYNKEKEALAVSANLDALKDFCKNQNVEIFKYNDAFDDRSENSLNYKETDFIFKSDTMRRTIELLEAVAPTDTTVLIQGETGTGKGFIAKLLHMSSDRKDKPFVDINCAAIPEKLLESELFGYEAGSFTGALDTGKPGLFETAGDGTVFLDEINSLPMSLQVKFLRVIQEKEVMRVGGAEYLPVEARIIVATNTDLLEAVEAGTFREDLYYRLNIVPVTVAPLRNRKEDIRVLGQFFLERCNKRYKQNKYISDAAWKDLESYKWPGNVREMENLIERLSIVTQEDRIEKGDLTDLFSNIQVEQQFESSLKMTLKEELNAYEKRIIEARMDTCKTTAELAKNLGIDKSTLTRKIRKLGIKR
ncbi:sigma 54-interacting transcriptional regulator [Anaerovorax odorimutans]|uniref:HTH-type transcriptional regulatory protein TyrR n=1 Tax=Anaerovorax odorimutans TaxID=109327 RepID=A0ABT1RMM2_9FIRM|nr:sigma 54-interacting transcriptional regulator [Anaerovorax odorimutans]MCQ4636422.1 sigma 54-interacting transcriptional regulator [Anaerovorax odorimutans]